MNRLNKKIPQGLSLINKHIMYCRIAGFYFAKLLVTIGAVVALVSCSQSASQEAPVSAWSEDFRKQPVTQRPRLEVTYTDASRAAFRIVAEAYRLTGQLESPHQLIESETQQPWLWMEMEDAAGQIYSTQFSPEPSRINLYRRGPYYCEIHWLDLKLTTRDGTSAPLRGDLILFCYPEKILAEINWYATADFPAAKLYIKGVTEKSLMSKSFVKNTKQSFPFPLFGETPPLPNEAFELIEGEVPVYYDYRKGCYLVGTVTSDSFQKQFYDFPNRYENATFTLTNDSIRRKIYICHESVVGGAIVEGGVLLDEAGHPMPVLVQISKNFDGEKEEPFYNPLDTAFSETYFPLYLEPHESVTLSSLHLYQNWGRHMTKHWSSLGAWMDYFHSSTGVTETTCYVPFKFAGLGGVAIADFRAMSQETFWSGQPQHDNLAGHSFLSYYNGTDWQHSVYQGTTYRSTGPNWFDIGLSYISSDSSIRLTVDVWETPQADQLRSFFRAKYEVLKPLGIPDAKANFRLLTITSAIQKLRFSRFAANNLDNVPIDFDKPPFPIKGIKLPEENAFIAEYGDDEKKRGSNAVIIRKYKAPPGIGLSAGMQVGTYKDRFKWDEMPNTRLYLAPNVDALELDKGDIIEIDGFWLPYGPTDHAVTPRKELSRYGHGLPHVLEVSKGALLSDLPVRIKAAGSEAIFTIQGGKDLVPVVVTGLPDWRYPRIWQKEGTFWRPLSHARNTTLDGYQVFVEDDGSYGAVFLVHADQQPQQLKVTVGEKQEAGPKIDLAAEDNSVYFTSENAAQRITLFYPKTNHATGRWNQSEGRSWWFEEQQGNWKRGGRVTPNEEDIDLEYWWDHVDDGLPPHEPRFFLGTAGTPFADPDMERTWALTGEGWKKFKTPTGFQNTRLGAVAIQSTDGKTLLAMAWHNTDRLITGEEGLTGITLTKKSFPPTRRYHVRGKIYLFAGDLQTLAVRINREMDVL